MDHHAPTAVQRHCDVAIVGGSAAGLAAALPLARQRRSVIVLDDGHPRNAPAAHLHGYLGWDGASPNALITAGRAEVRSYGGEILSAHVTTVTRVEDGRFHLDIDGGHRIVARRVVAATGIVDELPVIEGLAERWGRDVIHCPFCHGFEVRDRRIVDLVDHPSGLHQAALLRRLTDRLTVVLRDGIDVAQDQIDMLRAGGVDVRRGVATRIVTEGAGPDQHVTAVELADGARLDADAVVVAPRFRARIEAFAPSGLTPVPHASGLGEVVQVDPTGATTVPGLYAAGNVTEPGQQVLPAAAHGSQVGAMVAFSLAEEDLRTASRPSGVETDWDQRYSGEPVWSGRPNGTVVAEVAGLTPGRALDVGAGEGGDAIWLAEQGWDVTASDISGAALERVRSAAQRRGVTVSALQTDANALDAFPIATFDLVTASYASFPRTTDSRGLTNMLGAVAPGGTLLVVGHDLTPLRDAQSGEHPSLFDADAYVQVDDVAAVLDGSPEWTVDVHEKRPRPAGAVSTGHVDDLVLRARRSAR